MAYEQTFKNIDNILHTDEGCGSELDYIEQKSWILFLKYLDDLEKSREVEAMLQDKEYTPIIAEGYRWSDWAMPKTATGEYDIHNALVGDDLIEFVRLKLFPYLKKFSNENGKGVEGKIGVIFNAITNKIASGYNLRDILEQVDELKFQTSEQRHELTYLYESSLNKMGNAGRNGGEYYTPRPLIRTILKVLNPEIGKTVYDGACGSAGFLCEAYTYMHEKVKNTSDEKMLQESTFYGKELKGLAYIIAIMNLILHGVESPNIIRTNTLTENLADVQEKDRFDYILANPPFGAKKRAEVLNNFPIKSGETAFLFLQHFIKYLRAGGSAGIVIKNTFLSNMDADAIALRKKLLEECNLHTVLDLPQGVFQAGVKTVVLFFKKGEPTKNIWFYKLDPDRTLGKTNPLNEDDLKQFVELQKEKKECTNSWSVDVASLDENYDLTPKNPNKVEVVDERTTQQIIEEIKILNQKNEQLLYNSTTVTKHKWNYSTIGAEFKTTSGGTPNKMHKEYYENGDIPWLRSGEVCKKDIEEAEMFITQKGVDNSSAKWFPKDTVLVAMYGATAGQVGILRFPSTTNQAICGIFPNEDFMPDFLYYALLSGKDALVAKAVGNAQPNISQTKVKDVSIPKIGLIEQQRVVERLDTEFANLDALKTNAERIISLCDDMKQALLRDIFNKEP